MLILKNNHYSTLSTLLYDRIEEEDFFSGSINYQIENIECELLTTIIIYRQSDSIEQFNFSSIVDIVPVWWEFTTVVDGELRLNDFDFQLLKNSLCHN
ncbi:MAG: hypothetical protein SNJ33_02135 [Rikenellaceae bacterium]